MIPPRDESTQPGLPRAPYRDEEVCEPARGGTHFDQIQRCFRVQAPHSQASRRDEVVPIRDDDTCISAHARW